MDARVIDSAAEKTRRDVVERAEVLYRDLDHEAVARWKSEGDGRRAVGYLPVFAPREVIHAAGALPVAVAGGGDRLEIVRGDAYFQSYICHLPRSTVELGLSGRLDALDGMVFPSTCDVVRNLSGMWKILFPDKLVRYFDVPQNFDEEMGGAFMRREIEALIDDLESLTGVRATPERLGRAIAEYDENRRLVDLLYQTRTKRPWDVPSAELFLVVRAGGMMPVDAHNRMLEEYLGAVRASERQPMDMARVVVRGTFCEQPPVELIRTLERAGCYIVDDDWLLLSRWFEGGVGRGGDPLTDLVTAFLERSPACPSMYLAEGKKGEALVARVKQCGAEGVLFAAPSFCDPALLDQPMVQAAVERAGIPHTSFLYSENTGQFQVIREQSGTFADAIKLA